MQIKIVRWVRWVSRESRRWRTALVAWWTEIAAYVTRMLPFWGRGVRVVLIAPLYLSFVGYTHLWDSLQPLLRRVAGSGDHLPLRMLLCSLLSAAIALSVCAQLHADAFIGAILLGSLHGVFVHALWQEGLRWCKRQLGIRPRRQIDPQHPFANLDLGN